MGSNIFDCKPQKGPCPLNCNQCFYNRPYAYYHNINEPLIPTIEDIGGTGIVRINCGHDSNLEKDLVLETTSIYKHKFFNTSIDKFDFPVPVVYTANREEEKYVCLPPEFPNNIMFVRLRVSSTNIKHIDFAVSRLTSQVIPVVLTFMAYYEGDPPDKENYEWKVRHINSYWCASKDFMFTILKREKAIGGRLVTMCGTLDSNLCKDCGNCETYYWQTIKHMKETMP